MRILMAALVIFTAASGCGDSGQPDNDTAFPARVDDLSCQAVSSDAVVCSWTAVGDDGHHGRASRYWFYHHGEEITATNLGESVAMETGLQPGDPGAAESFQTTGLRPETEYCFAVAVGDDAGNVTLSNSASATTEARSACHGRECGPDGLGGVCGSGWCGDGETCNLSGRCVPFAPMMWVVILAGTFTMGSPEDEPGHELVEVQHEVTLTHSFAVLSTEVTIGEFVDLMGYDPVDYLQFYLCDRECPVSRVNWHEAAAYCNALSAAEGYPECYTCTDSPYFPNEPVCEQSPDYPTPYDCPGFRLPTGAEWEYAVRAGTTTSTYNGTFDENHLCCERPNPALDPIAWFCGEDDLTMHPVGQKQPNSWGLYDMLGNQWEWCHDFHDDYPPGPVTDPWGPPTGTPRVQRGGCYHMCAFFARSAYHGASHPNNRDENSGFRPVRTLP